MGIAALLFGAAAMALAWFSESGVLPLVSSLLALGFGTAEAFRSRSLTLPVAAGIVLGLLALLFFAFFHWTSSENDELVLPPPETRIVSPLEIPQTIPAPRVGLPGPVPLVPGIGWGLPGFPPPPPPSPPPFPRLTVPANSTVSPVPAMPAAPPARLSGTGSSSPASPAAQAGLPVPAGQSGAGVGGAPVSLPESGIAPELPSSSSEPSPALPPLVSAPPSTAASSPGREELPVNAYSLPAEMLPVNATSLPAEMKPANATSLPAEMKPANATSLPATLVPR